MIEPVARRGFLATVFGALVSPWLPKKKFDAGKPFSQDLWKVIDKVAARENNRLGLVAIQEYYSQMMSRMLADLEKSFPSPIFKEDSNALESSRQEHRPS